MVRTKPMASFTLSELAREILSKYPNKSSFVNDAIIRQHMQKLNKESDKTNGISPS